MCDFVSTIGENFQKKKSIVSSRRARDLCRPTLILP